MKQNAEQMTHVRQGRWIKDLTTGEVIDHGSINVAKRRSREMQRGGRVVRLGKVRG